MGNSRKISNTIALSFSPDADVQRRLEITNRAIEGLAAFGEALIYRVNLCDHSMILTSCSQDKISTQDGVGLVTQMHDTLSQSGAALSVEELHKEYNTSGFGSFENLEAPFLIFTGTQDDVSATSDKIGLGHIFSWQGQDCSVISTSATLIAKIFDCKHSNEGVLMQMTVGHRLGNATAFTGIELAPIGARLTLKHGKLSITAPVKRSSSEASDVIKDGSRVIADAVTRCLSANPDCGIELSGGLDSRMVLAAIPKELRQGRTAYTIGYEGSQDTIIARDLAKKYDMHHVFVDLSKFSDESTETTWERARRIAHRDDFSSNIFDRLTLDCVDDELLELSRIGGVDGELARGFYFANMPITAPVSQRSIDRLIAWRLTTNDAAPRDLFDSKIQKLCATKLHDFVSATLKNGPQPLGKSLDQFYLEQRMRHWAGGSITRAITSRMVLAPFFHSDYVDWASGIPVELKKDSMAFCSVLAQLDPELADIALDSGLVPSQLANGGQSGQFALLKSKMKKLATKVIQRLFRRRQSNLGSQQFQGKLCNTETMDRVDWQKLAAIELFNPDGLEKLRERKLPWNRVTLGYVFSLHFQLEYLAKSMKNDEYKVVELRIE